MKRLALRAILREGDYLVIPAKPNAESATIANAVGA
jgi:hypothetical protein